MMPTHFEYKITPSLDEYLVWVNDVRPALAALAENALEIWQYAVTEMFNNAIDHSGGAAVSIRIQRTESAIEIVLSDDGVGIFRKIQAALNLTDERQAILELSKGKLTTDPSKHSGQGIFFTSRMLDSFGILSGGAFFSHEHRGTYDWMIEVPEPEHGTAVCMRLGVKTTRTLTEVFDQYSSGPDYDFTKTVVPVSLARYGSDNLVSRSQAKLVLSRVDLFETVVFDFVDVAIVRHSFADEIFRVFAREHPKIQILIVNANAEVLRAIAAAGPAPNVHY